MKSLHYSDDDLLDRLYETGRTDDHLEQCETCRLRWERLLLRRRQVLVQPEISSAWLARAHMRLAEQMEKRPAGWIRAFLRPALAATALIVIAILAESPAPRPAPEIASGDAQLLSEICTLIQEDEPRAATPVRALFEVNQ